MLPDFEIKLYESVYNEAFCQKKNYLILCLVKPINILFFMEKKRLE